MAPLKLHLNKVNSYWKRPLGKLDLKSSSIVKIKSKQGIVTQITVLPSSIFPSKVCHNHTVVVFFAS